MLKINNIYICIPEEPIVFVFISTPIQLFFAWRIKVLIKSNILALIIAFFALVSMGVLTSLRSL